VIADPHPFVSRFRAGFARLVRIFSGSRAASAIRPATIAAREPRRTPEAPGVGATVITRTRAQTRRPNMYRVLLINDDYTPMEFVVDILQRFFSMDRTKATRVMLEVHMKGKGVCGVFTYEIAETKVAQVIAYARQHQHPLMATLEEA
jgi:ATP-dependent Clp protease adaptor protein ClpS